MIRVLHHTTNLPSGKRKMGDLENVELASEPMRKRARCTETQKTIYFGAGRVGLEFDPDTDLIEGVYEGPAKDSGVQKGWLLSQIDDNPFTEKLLLNRYKSNEISSITFVEMEAGNVLQQSSQSSDVSASKPQWIRTKRGWEEWKKEDGRWYVKGEHDRQWYPRGECEELTRETYHRKEPAQSSDVSESTPQWVRTRRGWEQWKKEGGRWYVKGEYDRQWYPR